MVLGGDQRIEFVWRGDNCRVRREIAARSGRLQEGGRGRGCNKAPGFVPRPLGRQAAQHRCPARGILWNMTVLGGEEAELRQESVPGRRLVWPQRREGSHHVVQEKRQRLRQARGNAALVRFKGDQRVGEQVVHALPLSLEAICSPRWRGMRCIASPDARRHGTIPAARRGLRLLMVRVPVVRSGRWRACPQSEVTCRVGGRQSTACRSMDHCPVRGATACGEAWPDWAD